MATQREQARDTREPWKKFFSRLLRFKVCDRKGNWSTIDEMLESDDPHHLESLNELGIFQFGAYIGFSGVRLDGIFDCILREVSDECARSTIGKATGAHWKRCRLSDGCRARLILIPRDVVLGCAESDPKPASGPASPQYAGEPLAEPLKSLKKTLPVGTKVRLLHHKTFGVGIVAESCDGLHVVRVWGDFGSFCFHEVEAADMEVVEDDKTPLGESPAQVREVLGLPEQGPIPLEKLVKSLRIYAALEGAAKKCRISPAVAKSILAYLEELAERRGHDSVKAAEPAERVPDDSPAESMAEIGARVGQRMAEFVTAYTSAINAFSEASAARKREHAAKVQQAAEPVSFVTDVCYWETPEASPVDNQAPPTSDGPLNAAARHVRATANAVGLVPTGVVVTSQDTILRAVSVVSQHIDEFRDKVGKGRDSAKKHLVIAAVNSLLILNYLDVDIDGLFSQVSQYQEVRRRPEGA